VLPGAATGQCRGTLAGSSPGASQVWRTFCLSWCNVYRKLAKSRYKVYKWTSHSPGNQFTKQALAQFRGTMLVEATY